MLAKGGTVNHAPHVSVIRDPLLGKAERRPVALGTRIRDLEPPSNGGPIVCRFNGEWLLREHWDETVSVGDLVEFVEYPQNVREIRRYVLIAAVIITSIVPGLQVATPYLAASLAVYNLLNPPRAPNAPPQLAPAGSVYATSLSGNTARLDQPIWKTCGRVKITPPFAAQPYSVFQASDPENPTVDTDQYFYAIFAIGVGEHEIEKALIGKTPIGHFQDVLAARYLPPGTPPSSVLANVVTSDEVNAALELPEGRYVGGYAASRPGDDVRYIGIDIAASQGLGDGVSPITVTWQVEAREIDEYGRAAGNWQIIGTESRTAATNTPQRWSETYTLATPFRCEVRVARTNLKNSDPNVRDGIQWIGMRAYLDRAATLNADVAHYEVVLRASDQLSQFSQRDFSMIVRGKVRTWDPDTGWGAAVFTRNAMWWLADLWTNEVWGEGLDESLIDLQGLYDIAQTLDERQDRFDYCFTSSQDAWEAAQLIAHSARCRAFRKGGIRTVVRDELVDVPVTAFTSRNTEPKSMILHAAMPGREQPDGVIVQYQSNVIWDTAAIECPCPGESAPLTNPIYIGLDGVTGAKHAEREGLYQAAALALRTSSVEAKVEMEGVIVSFLDAVRWQPQIRGYGQTGDVAFWDEDPLVMGLSEPADFSAGSAYLTLQRDDGTLTEPVAVLPGPTVYDVILPEAPDFTIYVTDGMRERPKYLLGSLTTGDELVRISTITDGGKSDGGAQLFNVEAVIDDDRVHEADNHLLPGPGETQDPIDDGSDVPEDDSGGTVAIPRLVAHYNVALDLGLGAQPAITDQLYTTIGADGSLRIDLLDSSSVAIASVVYPQEWLAFPVEASVRDDYEVRAVATGFGADTASIVGTFDAWLPLTSDRVWGIDGRIAVAFPTQVCWFTLQIRHSGFPDVIQTSAPINLGTGSL
jgi:hypothetical protein